MNMYERFKAWTEHRPATDLWRAGFGIVFIFVLLYFLTGCVAPSMTLASSHEGDGFIQVTQPVYQSYRGGSGGRGSECTPPKHEVFFDYIHHSEIFRERNEDTYDGLRLGYKYNFENWKWNK